MITLLCGAGGLVRKYYRLDVLSPQNSYIDILTPNVIFWGGAEVVGMEPHEWH